MVRIRRIAGGALALSAALALSTSASWAALSGALTSAPVTSFATQAVTAATGSVQIPAGVSVAYTATIAVAGTFNITFTLPSGNFSVTPSATPDGTNFTSSSFVSGGVGNNSVTYQVVAKATGAGTLTLGNFGLTGATALEQVVGTSASGKSTGFAVTASVSSAAGSNLNPSPGGTGLANSVNALGFITLSPPTPGFTLLVIDVGAGGLGEKFIQAGGSDTTLADLGGVGVFTVASLQVDGVTPFAFPGGSTATVVLSGNFSNIGSAYLAPAGTFTCASTPPSGSISGTPTASSITFTGVTPPSASEICITANGTGVIGSNPNGVASSASLSGTTVSITAPGTVGTPLDTYDYNGIKQAILYSGSFSSYPMFIRIVNNGGTSGVVLALVQTEAGSSGVDTVAMVGAKNNLLVSASSIISGSGVTPDPTGRVSMILLAPKNFAISQLLLNPDSSVVQLGGQNGCTITGGNGNC